VDVIVEMYTTMFCGGHNHALAFEALSRTEVPLALRFLALHQPNSNAIACASIEECIRHGYSLLSQATKAQISVDQPLPRSNQIQ